MPPGKYTVKITKSGYYDWIKDVEVKEMQTVYIKEIILMKKNDPVILDKGSVSTVVISPNNKYLAYAKNSGVNSQIWLKNLKDDSTQLILDFKDTSIKLVWDDNGEYLAISNARAPHNSLVVVPIENSDKKFDLVKLIKYPIDKFQWKKAIEPELFFSTKLKIMSLAPNTRRISTLSKNNFLDWSLENGQIWALINSTSSAKIEVIKDILGFKDTFYTLDGHPSGDNKQKLNINLAVRDNVLLSYPGGQTISLLRRNKNFVFGGQQTLISPYNNWWLIWSPWELWGYVENEEPILLNRAGEQLRNVLPMDKYNALALVWADNVSILYPYYLVTHNFINSPIIDATVDTKNRIFYFSGNLNGQSGLWKLLY